MENEGGDSEEEDEDDGEDSDSDGDNVTSARMSDLMSEKGKELRDKEISM